MLEKSCLKSFDSLFSFLGADISQLQSTLSKTDTFGTGIKCPSYRESNKGSKETQGPTLSVRFTEVSVKRESTVEATLALQNKLMWLNVKSHVVQTSLSRAMITEHN